MSIQKEIWVKRENELLNWFSWEKLILALLAVLFLINIILLWKARGENVVGWELIGPAEGALNIYRDGLWEAIKQAWYNSRHYRYYGGISSVLFSVLPGFFHVAWPWLMWGQLLTLLMTVTAILLSASSIGAHRLIVISACVASGTLMSLSIIGGVYVSGVYLYALAIPIALRRAHAQSSLQHLLQDLVLWALFFELCFHCYEAGRAACLIPLISALTIRGMAWRRRILWLAISLAMIYLIFYLGSSSFNSNRLFAEILVTLAAIPTALENVWLTLIIKARLDYPFVLFAATLSLFTIKQHRNFWICIVLLQFATIIALAILGVLDGQGPEVLRARRYGAVTFILAIVVGYAWNHGLSDYRQLRRLVVLLLAIGMVAVTNSSLKFYQNPSQRISLPFTESYADFHIHPQLNEDAARAAALAVKESRPMFFLYGYGDYAENATDPIAFPERLLLHLGPERFLEQVVYISRRSKCRYSCVPMTAVDRAQELLAENEGRAYFFVPRASLPGASIPAWDPLVATPKGIPVQGTWLANVFTKYGAKQKDIGLSHFEAYILGD